MGMYVRLSPEWTKFLFQVSQRERRRPSDQAAILLEQMLKLERDRNQPMHSSQGDMASGRTDS
jgi:hypothetical protein